VLALRQYLATGVEHIFLGYDHVAFLVAVNQMVPLVGAAGLQPAARFLDNVSDQLGPSEAFVRLPTLFWQPITYKPNRGACATARRGTL